MTNRRDTVPWWVWLLLAIGALLVIKAAVSVAVTLLVALIVVYVVYRLLWLGSRR
jgi:hypothetical protein